MIVGKKVRLHPTQEQEILFWKSAGTSRWAYNYFLGRQEEVYQEYLANGQKGRRGISEGTVRKEINRVLKPTTHTWLKDIGSNVMKQAVKTADKAWKKYLKGLAWKPKFKSKKTTKPSFYVNYESLSRKNGGFHGEKIGFVRTAEPLPRLAKKKHYLNPWISFDGKYWYLGFSYEVEEHKEALTGDCIGIDLGVKSLAVLYSVDTGQSKVVKNINKSRKIIRLEKKLKRAERKRTRQLSSNILRYEAVQREGKRPGRRPVWKRPIPECKNQERQRHKIKLLYRKLKNIRSNHLHQATTAIVKTKPSRVVLETLNIQWMLKNKHLAKAVSKAKLYEFRRQIEYKCQRHGIEVVFADKFFPSSKQCSSCGKIHHELTLSNRVFSCSCGLHIDRDLNAAINLAHYIPSKAAYR